MKRWGPTYLLLALFCIPLFLARATTSYLLKDSDTDFLLGKLSERIESGESIFKWFWGDWPLGNHFYRPISTLTFEFDRWTWGTDAAGFGLTNVLLAVACVWALFWLVREISGSRSLSLGTAGIFVIWNLDGGEWLGTVAYWIAFLTLGAMFLKGRKWQNALVASLLWVFVGFEASGVSDLRFRMIEWLPGRTASTMTLFAIFALAAYVRFERMGALSAPDPPPSPFELPPSKSFVSPKISGWKPYLWLGLSLFCLACALGSYEQAIMVPPIYLGLACLLRTKGHLVRWHWAGSSFVLLIIYLLIRHQVIPSTSSAYQEQQFRSSISVFYAIFDYLMPGLQAIRWQYLALSTSWTALLFAAPWIAFAEFSSNIVAVWQMIRKSNEVVFYFGASVAAYLPMAWFKQFDHYHYLPMALRSGLFVTLVALAGTATLIAASHPALQVPPQPNPEPN